jgi:hypothetical protein
MQTELAAQAITDASLTWTVVVAFAISLITVFALIFGRYEIRLRRLRLIRDYVKTFPVIDLGEEGTSPSFEFVRSKYAADVSSDDERDVRASSGNLRSPEDIISEINDTISKTRVFLNRGDLRLLTAAIPYLLVVTTGFILAFSGFGCFETAATCLDGTTFNLLTVGGMKFSDQTAAVDVRQLAENVLTVAAITFIGAYLSSLRYLVQALAVFDLNGYTMIRQAAMIVISVLASAALYRALPDLSALQAAVSIDRTTPIGDLPPLWILLGLAFGLLPGSVLQFILVKIGTQINWIKQSDNRFIDMTRVVPLDAIDGIDFFTRFRLEECGISDVQSLATYNPIMLHIETPYGIYQTVDWIAQAQLCCVVGLDRFLLLRQFNVRTIFDLERALKQNRKDDSEADKQAIDAFDRIYASVLFAPTGPMKLILEKSTAKFLIPGADGQIMEVDAKDFSIWALTTISETKAMSSRAVEHLMDWIGDDLHVRRLRRLWNEISGRLGQLSLELTPDHKIGAKADAQDPPD